ncbi:MAG: acetylornithine deacetylase [Bacteroidetes bacterium 43-16]|nr:MAG: acetylornithine deacetylase [Bacteroidetes bacterium 43-16]
MQEIKRLQEEAIKLLQQLIATPSFSKEEGQTAVCIRSFLEERHIDCLQVANNIIAKNFHFDAAKPVILLNSHHDTVRPNIAYTLDPFEPLIADSKLFGLGSNDAGACLVSLIAAFVHYYPAQDLPFNLVLATTAEEEISGKNGLELVLNSEEFAAFTGYAQEDNWAAIVGEPTLMQMAVAEKGLMVIDAYAQGKAGHAAREEGENALYIAMQDILFLSALHMEQVSPFLGPVKTTVTVIETENKQHNVVPALCHFVIDVRLNELYTPEAFLAYLELQLKSKLNARSMRLRATAIAMEHPLVKAGLAEGKTSYGSPTTSDKALMGFPALKMGPGDSARSHMADEFIYIEEIRDGVSGYISFLQKAQEYYA